jgi:hypothetical protein
MFRLSFPRFSGWIFLLLFTFPQAQKSVHDFHHRHDAICDAKTEQHFHTLEHVCDFCDYKSSVGKPAELQPGILSSFSFYFEIVFLYRDDSYPESDSSKPPRGPPFA